MLAEALSLIFVLFGAGSWLVEHQAQAVASQRLLAVRPPGWVAWLCGNPRRDGTLELDGALRQLAALIFVVGAPLAYLVTREPHRLAACVFLAYVAVALPTAVLLERARWRAEREPGAAGIAPDPSLTACGPAPAAARTNAPRDPRHGPRV
jgi:hypothetical protein